MSAIRRWLLAVAVLLVRRRPPAPREDVDSGRIVQRGDPSPRAELAVIALFLFAGLCAVGFIVVYALDRLPRQTQFLGLSLGLAFLSLAAASIVACSSACSSSGYSSSISSVTISRLAVAISAAATNRQARPSARPSDVPSSCVCLGNESSA